MKGFWLIALILISIGCSSPKESERQHETVETFPKIDLNDYDTVRVENDFQFIVLKELTKSKNEHDRAIVGYNHLSKEKHVCIIEESKETYLKSLKSRGIKIKKGELLEVFAKEYIDHLKGAWEIGQSSKLIASKVNNLKHLRIDFEARVNGFPRKKLYDLRFIQGGEAIYVFVSWTVDKSKEEFKNESLAMGLSFKELN